MFYSVLSVLSYLFNANSLLGRYHRDDLERNKGFFLHFADARWHVNLLIFVNADFWSLELKFLCLAIAGKTQQTKRECNLPTHAFLNCIPFTDSVTNELLLWCSVHFRTSCKMFTCRLEDLLGDSLSTAVGIGTSLRCIKTVFHQQTLVSCVIASCIGAVYDTMLKIFCLLIGNGIWCSMEGLGEVPNYITLQSYNM